MRYFSEPKIKAIKKLQGFIHAANTPASRLFFRDFNDFHVHNTSVGKAKLLKWYHKIRFRP